MQGRRCDASVAPGVLSVFYLLSSALLFFLHRSEQYVTDSQSRSHFLRHSNGRLQTGHIFVGSWPFFLRTSFTFACFVVIPFLYAAKFIHYLLSTLNTAPSPVPYTSGKYCCSAAVGMTLNSPAMDGRTRYVYSYEPAGR